MICIDSDVLIEIIRGKIDSLGLDTYSGKILCTTSVNVYEMLQNVNNKKERGRIYSMVGYLYILPLNRQAAIRSAFLCRNLKSKGLEIGEKDTLIAGIMQSHNCEKIITHNKKHFSRISGIKAVAI